MSTGYADAMTDNKGLDSITVARVSILQGRDPSTFAVIVGGGVDPGDIEAAVKTAVSSMTGASYRRSKESSISFEDENWPLGPAFVVRLGGGSDIGERRRVLGEAVEIAIKASFGA